MFDINIELFKSQLQKLNKFNSQLHHLFLLYITKNKGLMVSLTVGSNLKVHIYLRTFLLTFLLAS